MTITKRYTDSPYFLTKDTNNNDFLFRVDDILAARAVAGQPNQTTLFVVGTGTTGVTIQAAPATVLDILDPIPVIPPPISAPTDLTQGKLRINPAGGSLVIETNSDPRGRWAVITLNPLNLFFTNDTDNPEIQTWGYLQEKVS